MGTLADSPSVEAEIAVCCQAIYSATDPDVAMNHWNKLRMLMARKAAYDDRLYLRESAAREARLA